MGTTERPRVRLAADTDAERRVAAELDVFFDRYDLSAWTFTRDVVIDEADPIPHSHPVLTLNTRNGGLFLLGTYLHEQLHWFGSDDESGTAWEAVREELERRYPQVPVGLPDGCTNRDSSYLHLLVCWLELDALRTALGREAADDHVRRCTEVGVYRKIYATVLADSDDLAGLYRRHGLVVDARPGLPKTPTVE